LPRREEEVLHVEEVSLFAASSGCAVVFSLVRFFVFTPSWVQPFPLFLLQKFIKQVTIRSASFSFGGIAPSFLGQDFPSPLVYVVQLRAVTWLPFCFRVFFFLVCAVLKETLDSDSDLRRERLRPEFLEFSFSL